LRDFPRGRHKSCLINHRESPEPSLIPAAILDDTIRTLELLFPFGDADEAFLEQEKVNFWPKIPYELHRAFELDEFKF